MRKFLRCSVFLSCTLVCLLSVLHAQVKKIYLANDDHTDYMWTADEKTYKNVFLETLDYYMHLNDSTAADPYPYQSKWNCDGSYWIYTYEHNRSKAQFERLIRQIKEGKITVPLNTLISLQGAAPAEATIRDMYYAGSLKRRFGLDINLVLAMEDQVLPLGLSSLWAGSGAAYSWRGICACGTKVKGLHSRPHDMYWYKGIDNQRVLMKWYAAHPVFVNRKKSDYTHLLGTYLEAKNQKNAVEDCLSLMSDTTRYPYAIAAAFGKGGDDLKTLIPDFITAAKTYSTKDYEVIVSNEIDFFRDFEKRYGAQLPSETISYGSTEWGNSFASLAEVSASVKRSIERLRAAEALSTWVSLRDKTFAADLSRQRENAWLACGMFYEHDWTGDGNITRKQRADWQRKIAAQLNNYVDTLYARSLLRMGQMIKKADGIKESFFVFNPLSWLRTDYSDYPYKGGLPVTITDKTAGTQVPFQVIKKKGNSYLRILASDIPSLGYKVYEIKNGGPKAKSPNPVLTTDSSIENEFYKITFTRQGVITSLIDKIHSRECIKPLDKLFANDLGSGAAAEGDAIVTENSGAISATLVASSYKPIKHTTKITLFAGNDRIEIENYITQNPDAKPVTYSFSLNLSSPDIWHEEAGAVLNAKPVSKGGHYADSLARLDWLALNHFADISDNRYGLTLSNRDAYFMKTGKSIPGKLDDTTAQINVLATGQIDGNLGMMNQDGDSYFEHFLALKPYAGPVNLIQSMRFSLQHQNPLIAQKITGDNGYKESRSSLLSVSDTNVVVWALKPAEEGIDNGMILRIWNLSDTDKQFSLQSIAPIRKASKITHIETGDVDIPVEKKNLNILLEHNRMQTYRLFLK